jgi:hypothetical protein
MSSDNLCSPLKIAEFTCTAEGSGPKVPRIPEELVNNRNVKAD